MLGFIVGGLAALGAVFVFAGGGLLVSADDAGTGLGNALAGILVVMGLLIVTIAVIMIWGAVLALTGRSRVLLIVGASLLTAFGTIGLVSSLGNSNTTSGGIIFQLTSLVITILIIVLLSLSPATEYFAARRTRRGG